MIKKITLVILFYLLFNLDLYAKSDYTLLKELKELSTEQLIIFHKTYKLSKPFNVSNTMTAIAWRESNFKPVRGRTTPDYGVFQVNINTWKNRYKSQLKMYPLSDKTIANMLTNDFELGFLSALDEIKFWRKVHKDNWNLVWQSYNAGYGYRKGYGLQYSKDIAQRIRVIKKFIKE